MGSNTFGILFKVTTWGESHGKAIGAVIDGCPAGLAISEEEIQAALDLRRPGKNPYVSPRSEPDKAEILSGVFEGKTTGAPISIIIFNRDADSAAYEPMKDLLRPGHATFTYLEKYGVYDFRGGGRASARETACRVAAGAVAKKLLAHHQIALFSYIKEIAGIGITTRDLTRKDSSLFCPDPIAEEEMKQALDQAQKEGDSVGGVIEVYVPSLPIGLGDPVYEKLEANLAKAMLSLPASKGFEIGEGFKAARMRGSEHNDGFCLDEKGEVRTSTNFAGGTLAGISSGMPLVFRIAFKPASSIRLAQKTLTVKKEEALLTLPENSRHDPCVAIRAVPVVDAMTALVLADALLLNRSARL